jgi:hypothetical protein
VSGARSRETGCRAGPLHSPAMRTLQNERRGAFPAQAPALP